MLPYHEASAQDFFLHFLANLAVVLRPTTFARAFTIALLCALARFALAGSARLPLPSAFALGGGVGLSFP